jgi:hypothetical protein
MKTELHAMYVETDWKLESANLLEVNGDKTTEKNIQFQVSAWFSLSSVFHTQFI